MGDRLEGLSAVVTGGASGLGDAMVRRFVDEGASVVVADLQHERGAGLAAELGDAVVSLRCDVTVEADVVAAIDLARSSFGGLDVMVNNAGIVGAVGAIAETDSAAWSSTIDVLLTSVFYGTKHAAAHMVPRGSGSIINTTSIAGVIGGLGPHAYTAAKHAVVGLTKSVASEVGRTGVRCNAIAPGSIPTPLTANAATGDPTNLAAVAADQKRRYGVEHTALDIANAALYLASDESRLVNGHTLVVDAGRSVNGGSARFANAEAGNVGVPDAS